MCKIWSKGTEGSYRTKIRKYSVISLTTWDISPVDSYFNNYEFLPPRLCRTPRVRDGRSRKYVHSPDSGVSIFEHECGRKEVGEGEEEEKGRRGEREEGGKEGYEGSVEKNGKGGRGGDPKGILHPVESSGPVSGTGTEHFETKCF